MGLRGAERELVCIPFIPLLTDAFSALSLSDLRHTITLELQYDRTFLISLRKCVKEFVVFALRICGKRLLKIVCRRPSRNDRLVDLFFDLAHDTSPALSRAKIKISLNINSCRSGMIKQIVTDVLPKSLNYRETGCGRRNREKDFKDMIKPSKFSAHDVNAYRHNTRPCALL